METKLSTAVNAERHTRNRNTELAVRVAVEATWRSRITNAQACVVASMNGLGTGVEAIFARMRGVMDKLRLDLYALIRDGSRAACEKRIKTAIADITAISVDTFTAPGAGSTAGVKTVPFQATALMDLDVFPSWSVPLAAEASDDNAIEKVLAVLFGDVCRSHTSALYTVNALFPCRER